MKKYLIGVLILLMVTSCGGSKHAIIERENRTIEVIEHTLKRDTTIRIPESKSSITGKLIADSFGAITFNPIKSDSTEILAPPRIRIIDNYIEVDCHLKEQELFLEWQEKHKETKEVIEIVTSHPVPADLSWAQEGLIWLGRIALISLLVFIVLVMMRLKNSPFKFLKNGKRNFQK